MFKIIIFLLLLSSNTLTAQVGIGTSQPAASAVLELNSNNKGFLPPKLTTENIYNIPNPVAGLMVYNTITNKPCYYNGTRWLYFDTSYVLPEAGKYWQEGGGYVVYLDGTGLHGLITATTDQSISAQYGCFGTNIPGAQFTHVGSGPGNTSAILAFCLTAGIAARLCDELISNGKTDWYLPSKDELNYLFQHLATIPGLGGTFYISSSQANSSQVWMQSYPSGQQSLISQSSFRNVRAFRNF